MPPSPGLVEHGGARVAHAARPRDAVGDDAPAPASKHRGASPWWRRVLAIAFIGLVLALVTRQLHGVDWPAVGAALRDYPVAALPWAFLFAALSYALYASYELIGRHLTGHGLTAARTLTIGATAYALNLNLGALVGSLGARLRFYNRAGMPLAQATQVVGASIVTNWIGYAALAGAVLGARPPALPPDWGLEAWHLRLLGGVLLAVAIAYPLACRAWPARRWRWRGHEMVTPSARVALVQIALAAANWAVMAALVWLALQRQIDFASVATVLLFAAVAGALTHVPGGLGVVESVFLALLSHRLDAPQLLAGLVVYRFVYYLVPLALAGVVAIYLERHGRR